MDMEIKKVEILHAWKEEFQKRFDRLEKRAEKLGLEKPTLEWGAATWRGEEDKRRLWHEAIVTGPKVGFDGWRIVAALDLLDPANNVVIARCGTGIESRPEWLTNSGRCDHCNSNRRRLMTVVVRHQESGDEKVVGTDCLRDFAPGDSRDPKALAAYWDAFIGLDAVDESDDDDMGGSHSAGVIEPAFYLPYVAELVLTEGFVSRAKSEERGTQSTAELAMRAAYGRPERFTPSDSAKELARMALSWACEELEAVSDYERNIQTIARAGFGLPRHIGYITSIVPAYQRAMDRKKGIEKQRAQAAVSRYVGTVGEKIQLEVTLIKVITCNTMYGDSFLHIFHDRDGNILKWFCSGALPSFPEEGAFTLIKATVKAHDYRNGAQETALTRASIVVPKAPKAKKASKAEA